MNLQKFGGKADWQFIIAGGGGLDIKCQKKSKKPARKTANRHLIDKFKLFPKHYDS